MNGKFKVLAAESECAAACTAEQACVGYGYGTRYQFKGKCYVYGPGLDAVTSTGWEGAKEDNSQIEGSSRVSGSVCMRKRRTGDQTLDRSTWSRARQHDIVL